MVGESIAPTELAIDKEVGQHGHGEQLPAEILPDLVQHLTSVILGFVIHIFASTHRLDDGAGTATDRSTFPRDKSNDHCDVTQYFIARLGLFSLDYRPVE